MAKRPERPLQRAIRCPYHAWTYGLDGQLRHAPFLTESDGLRRDQLSLYPVAVETWGGFVFVNLTPSELTSERSVVARLAGTIERTRNYPLAELRLGNRVTYRRRCELEDDRRELQRVLSLRARPS